MRRLCTAFMVTFVMPLTSYVAHICTYIPYVWFVMPLTSYVAHICTYIPYVCPSNIFHIYPLWCPCSFWHIFGNSIWSSCCSWLLYVQNPGSVCPRNNLAVWTWFTMLQSYLWKNVYHICLQYSLLHGWCQWHYMWDMHIHLPNISDILHIWHIFPIWQAYLYVAHMWQ